MGWGGKAHVGEATVRDSTLEQESTCVQRREPAAGPTTEAASVFLRLHQHEKKHQNKTFLLRNSSFQK